MKKITINSKQLLLACIMLITGLFYSCEDKKSTEIFVQKEISTADKLKLALSKEYQSTFNFTDEQADYLSTIYTKNGFKPYWINDSSINELGNELNYLLEHKIAFGIPEIRKYHTEADKDNLIGQELALTIALGELTEDLNSGFLHKDTALIKPLNLPSDSLNLLFKEQLTPENICEQIIAAGPQDSIYQTLADHLYYTYFSTPMDESNYTIAINKEEPLITWNEARKALVNKGYIADSIIDSLTISDAIKTYQKDNQLAEDGKIGKFTAFSLNESTKSKFYRIALAMEKRRWNTTYPDKYIAVNLPEYKLRFINLDTIVSERNIVIGKWGNETPELKSKLRKIVLYPDWNVPYSISSKEILPAVKRDTSYLSKHNYLVLKGKDTIDPTKVEWKKIRQNAFPYKIVQQPGVKNSLGIVKFDFPNMHSVYFHDTPSKGLFGTKTRAYSHGCMRTQDPIDLAKDILIRDERRDKFNEFTPDSVDLYIENKTQIEVKLLEPIPVFVEYNTVVVNNNKVEVYPDIYKREQDLLRIFYQ